MPIELTVATVSIIGIIIGAVLNHLFTRNKTRAEIEKIKAETDKARAETEKTRAELNAPKLSSELSTLSDSEKTELVERITERIQDVQTRSQSQTLDALYKPPELSERIIYIFSARHDLEMKIRRLVLLYGGGWAGASMASFDTYFQLAVSNDLISKSVAGEFNDFYYFTQPMLNSDSVSDSQYLKIQYLAANLEQQIAHALNSVSKNYE
jgi:hypothetical protein